MAIWNWAFKSSFTEDERKLIQALKDSNIKSHRVIGRGTMVVDVQEVRSTEKFQEYAKKAKKIVDGKAA